MMIAEAIRFAATKHEGQVRKVTGLPYIIHPLLVSHLITKYKGDSKHIEELQCAAILHDVLEDTACTYPEIEREFGPLVASLVMELTSDQLTIDEIGKTQYLIKKMASMSNYAFILKLVDRLSNLLDSPTDTYCHDTLDLLKTLHGRRTMTERQMKIILEIREACGKTTRPKRRYSGFMLDITRG